MGRPRDDARLAFKTCDDKIKANWNALANQSDLNAALKAANNLRTPRCTKPVFLYVMDLVHISESDVHGCS
jgi:hypothetical protein